ncbi:MAG: trypsin-like peptidase domain-containing protein [Candidatus Dasytiphilus stammeri]
MKKYLIFSAILIGLFLIKIPCIIAKNFLSSSTTNYLPSLAPIVSKVMPTVVSISAEGSCTTQSTQIQPEFREFFNDEICNLVWRKDLPFCETKSKKNSFTSLGTGVIINARKGYVITNYHLINHTHDIIAQLNDGRRYHAKMIGKDEFIDLAVLKLQKFKNLTEIKFADSNKIRVGDYSIAIGNAHGLGQTVTSGIISALGITGVPQVNYDDIPSGIYFQTDTPMTTGNSGGPLINLNGELMGINTAKFYGVLSDPLQVSKTAAVALVIPANIAKKLSDEIIKSGDIKRGTLGIIGTELNSELLVKVLNQPLHHGILIKRVMPKSSAAISGMKSGDIIISLNGKAVFSYNFLKYQIATLPVGTKLSISLWRDGKIMNVTVISQPYLNEDKVDNNKDSFPCNFTSDY